MVDIINVKTDYGAAGNGSTDDRVAVQNALNAAHGTAGSPNGMAGRFNNIPIYFPPGRYAISSPGLVSTDLVGAWIFGMGPVTSQIIPQGGGTGYYLWTVNGCIGTRFERLGIAGGVQANGIDVDCLGSSPGNVGLRENVFSDMSFGGLPIGMRLANSGNDGRSNMFINCTVGGPPPGAPNFYQMTGLKIVGPDAVNNTFYGGGGDSYYIAIHVVDGQLSNLIGTSWADTANAGTTILKIDNDSTVCIHGGRSEGSHDFDIGAGRADICGFLHMGNQGFSVKLAGGIAINDACLFGGEALGGGRKYIEGTGGIFVRGCYYITSSGATSGGNPLNLTNEYTNFSGHAFTGTIWQNIGGVS